MQPDRASSGAFSTVWRVAGPAAFVARWRGDESRAGDGSPPAVVRFRRR